ncbi:hypothetical protein [Neobacillus sp. DY30]|uniref:hypothetical protein n=1 Tax=Neobacillus sp. DY30 TaxID=3047871 RepID=UPI0024C0CCBD|nr:hypothetical protein [Neobacillus sp. DY30]WHY03326.1 hypothetical protein QNH29_14355 [Neobacillus sp. DY30]
MLLLINSLLFGTSACSGKDVTSPKTNASKPKSEEVIKKDVRESVWNQLNGADKESIRGSWKDARVSKLTLKPGMGIIDKGEYMGREVYIVDFPITDSINSILVYASIETQEIIGRGYSD